MNNYPHPNFNPFMPPPVSRSSSSSSSSSDDAAPQRMTMPQGAAGAHAAHMNPVYAAAPQPQFGLATPAQPLMLPPGMAPGMGAPQYAHPGAMHQQQAAWGMPPPQQHFQQPQAAWGMPPPQQNFQQPMAYPGGMQQYPPYAQQAMGHSLSAAATSAQETKAVESSDDEEEIASDNYSGLVDNLVLNPKTHSSEEIVGRVRLARDCTNTKTERGFIGLETRGRDSENKIDAKFDSKYVPPHDTFIVSYSWREFSSAFNASDTYLAQMGKAMPADDDGLPLTLPKKIMRSAVSNPKSLQVTEEICAAYGVRNSTPITITLERNNPSAPANKWLHELLTNTPNGKSTARLVGDFNKAKGTEFTIDGVTVRNIPGLEKRCQLDFHVNP